MVGIELPSDVLDWSCCSVCSQDCTERYSRLANTSSPTSVTSLRGAGGEQLDGAIEGTRQQCRRGAVRPGQTSDGLLVC